MKKQYYILILMAALVMTGCQNNQQQANVAIEAKVVENVEIPEVVQEPIVKERVLLDIEDMTSDEIKLIQKKLIALNYNLKVDGIYGEQMNLVVSQFQKEFSSNDSDGKLDQWTLAAIDFNYDDRLVKNTDDLVLLVNKKYFLDENYEPQNLVVPKVPFAIGEMKLQKVASEALENMFKVAKEEAKLNLVARSGYRSYKTQVQLFARYVKNNGYDEAVKFSAKPGQSEHQTGLAMDITADSVNRLLKYSFGETKEGIWTKDNCYRFGFIVRYPADKTEITGYNYEPWHLRYVGKEIAKEIYDQDITLEDYLDKLD